MVSQYTPFILLKYSLKCLLLVQIILSTEEMRKRREFYIAEVSQRAIERLKRDNKKELQTYLWFCISKDKEKVLTAFT